MNDKIMTINHKEIKYFSDIDTAMDYIFKHYKSCTTRVMEKQDDKWIAVTSVCPQSNL